MRETRATLTVPISREKELYANVQFYQYYQNKHSQEILNAFP